MAEPLTVPRHIAIIPDGNRRYAKKKGLPPWEGHKAGSDTFRNLLQWCKKAGIPEVTFWAMSTDNLERDKQEVHFLFSLFEKLCDEYIKDFSGGKKKEDVRIMFCGELDRLPKRLQEKMSRVMSLTEDNKTYRLNLLVAYGGRSELLQAAKKIADAVKSNKLKVEDIDDKSFHSCLYLDSGPDLIIRTSRQRLSGLLPWQSDYSEIIFLEDMLWPEFSEADLKNCILEFSKRVRTFGK